MSGALTADMAIAFPTRPDDRKLRSVLPSQARSQGTIATAAAPTLPGSSLATGILRTGRVAPLVPLMSARWRVLTMVRGISAKRARRASRDTTATLGSADTPQCDLISPDEVPVHRIPDQVGTEAVRPSPRTAAEVRASADMQADISAVDIPAVDTEWARSEQLTRRWVAEDRAATDTDQRRPG
jgi:hypothetical protein